MPTEIIPAQPTHYDVQPQYVEPSPLQAHAPQQQQSIPIFGSLYSSDVVTIHRDFRIEFHGDTKEEAKQAVRELRRLKGESQRESSRLALAMREHRANHTRNVRNTIPHLPFYGKIGRTIRFGQTVYAHMGRRMLAADLQPYEQEKLALDALVIEIRGAIDDISRLYD